MKLALIPSFYFIGKWLLLIYFYGKVAKFVSFLFENRALFAQFLNWKVALFASILYGKVAVDY